MPIRSFRWAIVLCRFSDKPIETRPPDYYEELFATNGAGGVADYWRAVTLGNWDLSGSQVFGWFPMNHASTEVASLVFPGARATLVQWGRDAAVAHGVNLAAFDNVLVVHNYGVDHGAAANGVVIVDQDASLCEFGFICHEMGHGHGLPHSFSANPDFEYGDAWDLMSFATSTNQFDIAFRGAVGGATVGLNARNLEALGAIPARRLWTPARPDFSEEVTLQPLNQQPMGNVGALVAKLGPNATTPARVNGSSYLLEFRRRKGFDQTVPRDAVVVHEVRANALSYLPTWGFSLVAGEQFVTPAPELYFKVAAIDTGQDRAMLRLWDLPEGSLRKEDSKPRVYRMQGGTKRWLTSPQVLGLIGKTWADVRSVPDGALTAIPDGPNLSVLRVSVTPYPVPVNRQVTVTFHLVDEGGSLVGGTVRQFGAVGGAVQLGSTNTPISHTFRGVRRGPPGEKEVVFPTVRVQVSGYRDIEVDCGFPG